MSAALATTAWALAACAAGVLASRRYGEEARRALKFSLSHTLWMVWAWSAAVAGATIAMVGFGAAVGLPYWLSALTVCGAAIVACAHAWARMAGASVIIATSIAALTTGALLWTN